MIIDESKFRFGLRFMEESHLIYCEEGIDIEGVKVTQNVGHGVYQLYNHLKTGTLPALGNLIKCATAHLAVRPTMEDIDDYVTEQINKGDTVAGMCGRFLSLLTSAPLLRDGLKVYSEFYSRYEEVMTEKLKNKAMTIEVPNEAQK